MTPPREEIVKRYVGRPFDHLSYNCWDLVADVYAEVFGIELPRYHLKTDSVTEAIRAFRKHDETRALFEKVDERRDWDLIEYGGAAGLHVGLYLTPRGVGFETRARVLHNDRDSGGVVLEWAGRVRLPETGAYRLKCLA